MKYAFLISALVEIVGGLIIYFYPDLIFQTSHFLTRFYGIIATILGVICLYCFFYFQENVFFKKLFLSLMGFHAIIAFTSFSIPADQWSLQLSATLLHLGVFVFFVMAYLKDLKPNN